jgi:hypothetical protein
MTAYLEMTAKITDKHHSTLGYSHLTFTLLKDINILYLYKC